MKDKEEVVLAARQLDVGYAKCRVLSALSFKIQRGELVGLIGPNGVGKSTLLKTLRGLIALQGGQVFLLGEDIQTLRTRAFALKVAYLQQRLDVTFTYTAREIVLAGRYPYLSWWQRESTHDKEIVQASMEYTGVASLASRPIHEMSGGQLQRVLLAKVLAQQTPILFLDEPATGLDLMYQEEIFRFCRELTRAGKTILIVIHELSLAARFCSRLLLFANNKLLADGTVQQVLTDDLLSQAYQIPVRVLENPCTGHKEIFTEEQAHDKRRQQLLHVLLETRDKK